ncbi:cysteine hydrolase family protein [Kordiimonas aestuarii]|uniref:cysteine hydrolase family protein n=1 Tax=Kordiimonas aestuarii TaxID=1005925 RepID=UPI0021D2D79A|nr:cysteine hydrolase family protein [Kordiimonas aestuarii]
MPGAALIIIDVQYAIDAPRWGPRNNAGAEVNMARLLARWRESDRPLVHIRHDSVSEGSPYAPGLPSHRFKKAVAPLEGETVIGKNTNNAFVNTGLEEHLRVLGIDEVIICGVLTQHSVDTTARMASSLGFAVTVVSDATAATDVMDGRGINWPANDVHALTLAHLVADYADVSSTDEILVSSE